jgi:hypothetical protein
MPLFRYIKFINKEEARMPTNKAVDSEIDQKRIRKSFDDVFKVKVVLEALKETMTIAELTSKYYLTQR